jgi:hypothetical protein
MNPNTPEAEVKETDAWMPKNPGDSIEGVVTDLDAAWSDFRAQHLPNDPNGGNYPLVVIKTDDGETRKIHAFRTVLFNEVMKRQPKPGERIKVTFTGLGKVKTKGQSAPWLFTLETPDRNPDEVAKNVYSRIPGASVPATDSAADEDIPF